MISVKVIGNLDSHAPGDSFLAQMYPFGGIIFAPLIAGYLASVICRVRRAKGLSTGFWALAACVVVSIPVVWVVTFGRELLRSGNGKVEVWVLLLLTGLPSALLAGIAAAFVIDQYRLAALGHAKSASPAVLYSLLAVVLGIIAYALAVILDRMAG